MTKDEISRIKNHIEIHARRESRAIIITEILWKVVDELEHITDIEQKNEQLKAQIEKMKCCGNCSKWYECSKEKQMLFKLHKNCDEWELAE